MQSMLFGEQTCNGVMMQASHAVALQMSNATAVLGVYNQKKN